MFYNCSSLSSLPDISKWNNYNENDLNEKPGYERIKKVINFSSDILILPPSPDKYEIFNNFEFLKKQLEDKLGKFL